MEEDDEFSSYFVIAGLAGITATFISYPLDFVKARMNAEGLDYYKNAYDCIKKVSYNEGFFALYKGIQAAWLRQATLTSTRIGIFTTLRDADFLNNYDTDTTYILKFASPISAGTIAGMGSSLTGTPSEVIMNRMAADGKLHRCERRNYKGIYDAFKRIIKEEGIFTLWRGWGLSAIRATLLTITQLSVYSSSKEFFTIYYNYDENDVIAHFYSSMISGFLASVVSTPLDLAKVRLHNMKIINGVPQYRGLFDVVIKVLRREGFGTFTKGFWTDYLRMGPHTVIMLMLIDEYTKLYKFLKYKKDI